MNKDQIVKDATLTYLTFPFKCFSLKISYNLNKVVKTEFVTKCKLYCASNDDMAKKIMHELNTYLSNPLHEIQIDYDLLGSSHQLQVWQKISQISPGSYLSYGEIATAINSSPQAVGSACGKNPLPIIIPCHRVLSSGGFLGGFNQNKAQENLQIKKELLNHEGICFKG